MQFRWITIIKKGDTSVHNRVALDEDSRTRDGYIPFQDSLKHKESQSTEYVKIQVKME